MSVDGSEMGITADRALDTILGGKPSPTEEEHQTREQVYARVEAATANSYSGAADCMTRAVLRLLTKGEWEGDPFDAARALATEEEEKAFDGATGFMWGFAYNQARWLFGQETGGNPAIVGM